MAGTIAGKALFVGAITILVTLIFRIHAEVESLQIGPLKPEGGENVFQPLRILGGMTQRFAIVFEQPFEGHGDAGHIGLHFNLPFAGNTNRSHCALPSLST